MKPVVLRCLAEKEGEVWVGYCLSLDISVYGDSLADVKSEMRVAIDNYIDTVRNLSDEERAGFHSRRSPMLLWAKYYLSAILRRLMDGDANSRPFDLPGDVAFVR